MAGNIRVVFLSSSVVMSNHLSNDVHFIWNISLALFDIKVRNFINCFKNYVVDTMNKFCFIRMEVLQNSYVWGLVGFGNFCSTNMTQYMGKERHRKPRTVGEWAPQNHWVSTDLYSVVAASCSWEQLHLGDLRRQILNLKDNQIIWWLLTT